MRNNLLILLFCISSFPTAAQTFSSVTIGAEWPGSKDGGAVWADFDNDGDLDVLINTSNSTQRTRLLQQTGGSFSDVTTSKAAGLLNFTCERSAIWGDLNNDGNIDFVRNTYNRIEIYINRGAPDYIFGADSPAGGVDEMLPNFIITNLELGTCTTAWGGASFSINAEGVGLIDYNNDGWLDIIFENGECGVDVLENRLGMPPVSGASVINTIFNEGGDGDGNVETTTEAINNDYFRQVTTLANGYLGFPNTSGNGDYFSLGDYDGDGLVDVVVRKPSDTKSIWKNNGNGTFTDIGVDLTEGSVGSPTEGELGGKGGIVLCDFDRDGDFDIFWSDAGTNQIWLQHPQGVFTASSTVSVQPVIPGTPNIDGCACGDVNLDGYTDLFLGNNTGNSYLFINTTTAPNDVSALSFNRIDIPVNADAEGVNMIDYDGDGDYDLYVNVNGGANQMWENDFCDGGCNFLNIVIEDCIDGTTVTRPVVGAAILLKDTNGNIVNAKVDASTASGHGAQNPSSPLIGIPDPDEDYIAEITFPEKNGIVEFYSYQFTPSSLIPANTLTLTAVNGNDGSFCSFSPLPVELLYFNGEENDEGVLLKWATASERDNDYFSIERSHNGRVFDEIARVQGNGSSSSLINYSYLDPYPYNGMNYYRLAQYDFDGKVSRSKIIKVKAETNRGDGVVIFPNPVKDKLTINFAEEWRHSKATVSIYNLQGNKILEKEVGSPETSIELEWTGGVEGFYWIKVSNQQLNVTKKLVKISK